MPENKDRGLVEGLPSSVDTLRRGEGSLFLCNLLASNQTAAAGRGGNTTGLEWPSRSVLIIQYSALDSRPIMVLMWFCTVICSWTAALHCNKINVFFLYLIIKNLLYPIFILEFNSCNHWKMVAHCVLAWWSGKKCKAMLHKLFLLFYMGFKTLLI